MLVQSIADYVNGVQLGQIMIYIPESAIARELTPLLDMGVAFVALFDSRGQLLASFANAEWADFTDIAPLPDLQGQTLRIRDQEVLVNGADASAFGLKCVTILPLSAIARQVEPMQRAMLIYIACIGGAGLALAILAAMRSARPFVMLVRRLKGQHAKHTGIAPIDEAVDGLMENQSRLKQAMQDQNRLLESALSYRLIHGPLPEDELHSMLSFASRDLFSQAYLGVLIDICGEGDERRLRKSSAVIEELLGRIVPSVGFTVALSSRRMAVLYLRREPDGEDAVPFFTTLYRLLREQYGINTCFWVGKEVRALNDAHESFQSATHLADASAQDGARYIVTYAHPLYSAGSFHYGRAEAGELECLVKAGRLEELLSALGRIRAANLDRISVFQGKLLLCALTDTLLRASEEILRMPEDAEGKAQLDRMLPAIPEGALPWGFGQLERCFTLLSQVAVARKKSHNAELAGRVRAYVEAHCCEESLSLQRVSLEFGMNERYLSTFFREQFGENLQAYVTRLRVEEANRLMRETDLPLSAIAERVGYVNPNTFRSAYNRVMGYNPSDYERRTNA